MKSAFSNPSLTRVQLQASVLLEALRRVTAELSLVARAVDSPELAKVAQVGLDAIATVEAEEKP